MSTVPILAAAVVQMILKDGEIEFKFFVLNLGKFTKFSPGKVGRWTWLLNVKVTFPVDDGTRFTRGGAGAALW